MLDYKEMSHITFINKGEEKTIVSSRNYVIVGANGRVITGTVITGTVLLIESAN